MIVINVDKFYRMIFCEMKCQTLEICYVNRVIRLFFHSFLYVIVQTLPNIWTIITSGHSVQKSFRKLNTVRVVRWVVFFQSRSSCLGDLYTIFDVGTLKLRISTHFRHVHLYRALVMNALSRLVFYGTTVTGKLLILVCP